MKQLPFGDADVSVGSKADLTAPKLDFRFTRESGLQADIVRGPVGAKNRHDRKGRQLRQPLWFSVVLHLGHHGLVLGLDTYN
jgi:hypothetical protein